MGNKGEQSIYGMGENIANHLSDIRLISKIHKELLQLNSKLINKHIHNIILKNEQET